MSGAKSQEPTFALVFTDAMGRVVFVDHNFLKMMNCAEEGVAVGEPLREVLGIDHQAAVQLMREVTQNGYVLHRLLEVQAASDATICVWCTGAATYDNGKGFIGADFILQDATCTGIPDEQLRGHGDILSRLMRHIRAEARNREDQDILQSYFTAQVNALQVLLMRMGGAQLSVALEVIINEDARRNKWPITMQDGHIKIEGRHVEACAYRMLLSQAVAYVADVVGQHVVVQEMEAVDEQVDGWTLELAGQSGMRGIVNAL
jgi:hypothetical protein